MHCWLRATISVWVYIYVLLTGTLYFGRSHPLHLNTTTVPLNNSTEYKLSSDGNETKSNTVYNSALNTNQKLLIHGSNTSESELNTKSVVELNTASATPLTVKDNTTETPGNVEDPQSSINLAIIPALAILVFLIVFCIRCCKWFRSYTRDSEKEEGNPYASIIQEGDEDYGQVDILSDTASTAYNETVSSYCSFLRRSGNESTLNSFRSLKSGNRQSTPKGDISRKLSTKGERRMCELSLQPDKSPVSTNGAVIPGSTRGVRTISASSEETEPLTGSYSDSSDVQQPHFMPRKSQRFKVSFVDSLDERSGDNAMRPTHRNMITSTSEFSPNIDDRFYRRSSLKDVPTSAPFRCRPGNVRKSHSEKSTPVEEDIVFLEKQQQKCDGASSETPTTVSVGVQTNKSFRYSLWKSKRRFFSDPGHDSTEDQVMEELKSCSAPSRRASRDKDGKTTIPVHVETSKTSTTPCHSNDLLSERVCEVTIENQAPNSSPDDSIDEVFDVCQKPSVRYCKCSLSTNTSDSADKEGITTTKVINQLEQDQRDKDHDCKSTCHLTRPLMLKTLKECNVQNGGKLPICSKCKSAVVVIEGNQNSHLLVHNCDDFNIADICIKNRSGGIQNGRVITEIDKENIFENVSRNDQGDLIIEQESSSMIKDRTSSLMSLESSGYAELSSESSN